MLNYQTILLQGSHVQLEPLNASHQSELFAAAQNEQIWTYTGTKAYGERFYQWFDNALFASNQQQHLPFIVRRISDNTILGSTRYYEINHDHLRLTIGYTWLIPSVWGAYVNPECKFLLLQHAFETWHMNRVEFETDARNTRSRAAIKKLGALEEGLLRQHMVLEDGTIRDTIKFSIIKPDWPNVKSTLILRLKNLS